MHARGLLGDEERLADLAVGMAFGDQRQDGELALGEPEAVEPRALRGTGDHGAQVDARPPREPADLGRQQRRAQAGSDRGGFAQRGRGGATVAGAVDQRLALAPADVGELERLP